jgi:hypothetical protein
MAGEVADPDEAEALNHIRTALTSAKIAIRKAQKALDDAFPVEAAELVEED